MGSHRVGHDWNDLAAAAAVYMFGEGNGKPLQYSCLENPMDGGAWWAAVHGVATSRSPLSNFTFTFTQWRRKWQPTPVFLPGESQGRQSLVGCRLWGAQSWTRLKRLSSSSSMMGETILACFTWATRWQQNYLIAQYKTAFSFYIILLRLWFYKGPIWWFLTSMETLLTITHHPNSG